ncbi:MAG: SCO family protein [Acidimicrobiales bacterium]|jgi:cytochrome oxidase Cu insertion factor (SCO1/SenC/PrrC family)
MGGSKFTSDNPLVVSLFHHSAFETSASWIIAIAFIMLVVASVLRRVNTFNLSSGGLGEPRARTYLRMAFGAIWLIDGILQFQASMPLGMANGVVAPAAAGTPTWLHALMFDGIGIWNNHPITLAVGTAWIQVGIGLLLLVSNATIGRVAAAVSVGWASMIWLVGNGAGGIFQTTNSILFGWPGASLFYVVAGLWLALPPGNFPERFSRYTLRGLSVLAMIGALLQCLPSRGFWHGGNTNALASMTSTMTQTPQPHLLAWIVNHFGDFAGTIGGGFNVIVILWLVACAIGLWMASDRDLRWPTRAFVTGCLVFWVVAEDVPFWGGIATDVNSLVPLAILAWCASPARRTPTPLRRHLPVEMRSSSGAVVASFASAMVLFSVVSMGWATGASAESTLFLAQNGPAASVNAAASGFTLTDQRGATYSLGEHAGHYTLLTFLDPECWTDCPLLAAQLRQVRSDLSPGARLDIVAVAADPYHETVADVNHFIDIHRLKDVRDFYFVTGTLSDVSRVWNSYGIGVTMAPTDKMSIHSDYMFIITPRDRIKWIIPDEPLANWAGQHSAESELLTLLHQSGVH